MTGARQDGLPEFHLYTDDGCEVAPRCLECPLPICRYDAGPGGARSIRNVERNARIIELRAGGMTPDAIAAEVGTGRRTVFRVLAKRVHR